MRGHLRAGPEPDIAVRLAESMARCPDPAGTVADCAAWLADVERRSRLTVERADLAGLAGWVDDGASIRHASGKFFAVEGIEVSRPESPVGTWRQPILNQPEVGILGLLVRFADGVLHVLLQAKVEPGNAGGLQLSPTVQATRSNYTSVHGGSAVRFDHGAVGQDLTGVLEDDDAVAEQAPSLLGVAGDDRRRGAVRLVGGRAGGPVLAHGAPPRVLASRPLQRAPAH